MRYLKKEMTDIAILGAGNLGTSLAFALSKKGYTIKALSCRSISSVRESLKIIGAGKAFTNFVQAAEKGELIFICVPDANISHVVEGLASSTLSLSQKIVFHCSGLLSSKILEPLKTKGSQVGSFHPIQTFSQKKGELDQFEDVYFGLEGDKQALKKAEEIINQLGGIPVIIKAEDKPLYHSACSVASNFFVVLLGIAVSLLESTGLSQDYALKMILPLVQNTLQSVKEFDIKSSLTGPIARGDILSIKKHLEALKKFPAFHDLYLKLADQALLIAEKENLSQEKIKTMKELLGGK